MVKRPDPYVQRHVYQQVIQCLHAFGGAVQHEGTYQGPTLGVEVMDKHSRHFTAEQVI